MKEVKLCNTCKWSRSTPDSYYINCVHPNVNADDSFALSSIREFAGTNCQRERAIKGWFSICGIKGKLHEPKS